MKGFEFGKELKRLRTSMGIGSKELSNKAGKAVTYVSQLERGLIKKPDYEACFKLLKEVKFPEDRINHFLSIYGISPQIVKTKTSDKNKYTIYEGKENRVTPEQFVRNNYPWLYNDDDEIIMLKKKTEHINKVFISLIERDFTRAHLVIRHIEDLTRNKKSFDFFCSLFQYDFFNLSVDERKHLISLVEGFNINKKEIYDWEDLK